VVFGSSWNTQLSVAERKILQDAINVGCPEELRIAQPAAALGTFALKQMAPARAAVQNFAGASDLETLGYSLPGLNSFGTSHKYD
jgi:hypothetical protein